MNLKLEAKTKYLLATAAGAILLAGTALPGFAADPTPTATPSTNAVYCQPGGFGGWDGSALDSVAKLLGVSETAIATERQAGKSLAQIAQARGVSEDALVQAILADRKAYLDARVRAGTLTQAQADYMLQQMQTQIKSAVERTTVGPMAGAMGPGGRGMGGRGMRGQSAAAGTSQGFGPQLGGAPMGGGFGRGMNR